MHLYSVLSGPLLDRFHKCDDKAKAIVQLEVRRANRLVPVRLKWSDVLQIVYNSDTVPLADWTCFRGLYPTIGVISRAVMTDTRAWKVDFAKV